MGSAAATAPLNEAHLNQLMDMGFLQEHCREALYHTASVEQATEYLLENTFAGGSSSTNAGPAFGAAALNTSNVGATDANDMDTTLPLGYDADGASDADAPSSRQRRGMRSSQIVLPNDPPLSEQLLYDFSEEAVRTSLYLIDQVSERFIHPSHTNHNATQIT